MAGYLTEKSLKTFTDFHETIFTKMEICCEILHFLDKMQYLLSMKRACQKYLEDLTEKNARMFPPLRFLLEVDVIYLIDSHPDLGCRLIEEPIMWQNICSEILFACLSLESGDLQIAETVKPAQIAVNLRVCSVPTLLVQPNPRYYTGLNLFNGLLMSISKPSSYVYHTVWTCPEECEGNETILQYIPKVPPKCYVCKSILFENSRMRRCGEQVTATFQIKNDYIPKRFQIVDDLIRKLQLGAKYDIHVVTIKNKTQVLSIEETVPLAAPITSPVPVDLQTLFRASKGRPWQFVYCLASTIGVNVCPLSCFMHLKVILLLSLTSVKAHVHSDAKMIDVLAAGFDTGYVGQLMQEGAKLADSHFCVGTSNTTSADALVGCSSGVCVMPLPLHCYNKKITNSIQTSMESGEIATDTSTAKLRCVVWAQGMDFKKLNLMNVASVFGTVARGDYGEYNNELVDFALEKAVEPVKTTKEQVEALNDLRNYIDLVAGIHVTLDSSTELLLKYYFLAARKESRKDVPIVGMEALVTICLISARLCRRKVANIDDAVFAIWLHASGSPEPRIAPDEYLQTPPDAKRMNKIMSEFKDWLVQFTGSYHILKS